MKHINTVAIVGGGKLSKQFLSEIIKNEHIIGVDRGAYWLIANGITPDIAIGDFDSVSASELREIKQKVKRVEEHPKEKDFTDMELAVEHAITIQPAEVIIYGAIGSRFDHTMGNIYLLERLFEKGIIGAIHDLNNEVRIITGQITLRKEPRYCYVSLLPITASVEITLSGFFYDVTRASIRRGQTLGISNEIHEDEATIEVHRGKALLIQSRD
ncbi:MAG: Thiamine pyrophosphokinase [Microgenomates group bacterium GW2011_GWA2_47_8]|nr:MAG: Thiamine pyrophosphokinase [Microgenomates group bacterium GW2011_GWA2_47_8]